MSNEILDTLLEAMPDAVFVKDGQGRWLLANAQALRIFDLENQDYRGKSDLELAALVPFFGPALEYCGTSDEAAWRSGELTRGDETIVRPDGSSRSFDVLKAPMFNADGSRQILVILGRDITERIAMERQIADSELKYRTIANFTYDWEYWLGADGRVVYNSPSCERITGHSPEDFMENPRLVVEIAHPEDQQKVRAHLLSSFDSERDDPLALVYRIIRPDGEVRWLEHVCQPVYSSDGEWIGRRGSNRDITDRKSVELELAQTVEALKKSIKERKTLERFFSRDILDQVLEKKISDRLGGKRCNATTLFFDLRGSTGIAEQLDPDVFAEFLSMIHTDVMDLIYGNHGSVNKLIGDGILATFGVPTATGDDAMNAVRCAEQVRSYMQVFNEVRPDYLPTPVEFGIGIATGEVFAGNTGSVRRMEFTVLGDSVNLAARLESIAKMARVDILLDGETRRLLGDRVRLQRVRLDRVRGKMQKVEIFYMKEIRTSPAASAPATPPSPLMPAGAPVNPLPGAAAKPLP
ncbi:MAG: PAS domain S-box protein [Leptospirales bacterium]|nr:PAS domain S-box protein [Leptospirales bacterium]